MLAFSIYAILEFVIGKSWSNGVKRLLLFIAAIRMLSVWVFIISTYLVLSLLYEQHKVEKITIQENQVLLTNIRVVSSQQDYGTLKIDRNVDGNALRIGKKRFDHGFGTHANSVINFTLPDNVMTFSFIAGLDDNVEAADVKFSVWGDGRMIWESPIYYHPSKKPVTTALNIEGVKELSLRVDSMGNISADHADWVNPILTLKQK